MNTAGAHKYWVSMFSCDYYSLCFFLSLVEEQTDYHAETALMMTVTINTD